MSRGACDKVHSKKVIKKAKAFLKKSKKVKKIKNLPEPAEALKNKDVVEHLMNYGISSSRSEELSSRLQSLQRLASWYYYESASISEHEIRAYLVWPLLQFLGWSEQCVKFEWKSLDLALFMKPVNYDTKDQTPIVIRETKRLYSGLTTATDQANEYAEKYCCNKIMVTDGVRYFLSEYERGEVTSMYMNLLKLRDRHPYYEEIKGANEMLTRLLK